MLQFEWDAAKAAANLSRHRVSFDEARSVFIDPFAGVREDPDHSFGEKRLIIVGRSALQRLILVSFTERGDHIRIISARPLTRREQRLYEEANSKTRRRTRR